MIHWPVFSPNDPKALKYLKLFFALHLAVMIMMVMTWVMGGVGLFGNRDFIGFWAASRLLHDRHPEWAYDYHLNALAHATFPGSLTPFGWIHPPTTFLLYWPLGVMPCNLAWGLFVVATTGFLLLVIRRIIDTKLAFWATLASPALAFNAWNGQSGALNAAFLGLALLTMEKRPLTAGLNGALLACKPHLSAVLFLVELLHCRKALAFTLLIILALAGLATCYMGLPIWQVWWHSMPLNDFATSNAGRLQIYDRLASIFAVARYDGLGVTQSWIPHAIAALSAVAIVVALWRKPNVAFDIKAAAVPLATLLLSPYLFYYDYVLVLPGLAFWMRHICRNGSKAGEMHLMMGVWLSSMWVYFSGSFLHRIPLPQMLLLAALFFLLRRDREQP